MSVAQKNSKYIKETPSEMIVLNKTSTGKNDSEKASLVQYAEYGHEDALKELMEIRALRQGRKFETLEIFFEYLEII
jgi:hypothetical protein